MEEQRVQADQSDDQPVESSQDQLVQIDEELSESSGFVAPANDISVPTSDETQAQTNGDPVTKPTAVQSSSDQPKPISPAPSELAITPQSSAFAQMETFLALQLDKCSFYKKTFEDQGTLPSLVATFETFYNLTQKDLELLRKEWREGGKLPGYKFETIRVTCTPTNVDVKEKELHLVVRTSKLPVAEESIVYVIGEFDYPISGKEETIGESTDRWIKSVKIEPRKLICCSEQHSKQLDMVYATNFKPFYKQDSNMTDYERPMRFFVEKGRSRTLKRKFKPIKLTFYEKTGIFRPDKKLGFVQVKIDSINDDASLTIHQTVMDGRKSTEGTADIRVRVREPLVDKDLKTHEEKFLVLT